MVEFGEICSKRGERSDDDDNGDSEPFSGFSSFVENNGVEDKESNREFSIFLPTVDIGDNWGDESYEMENYNNLKA